MSVDAEARERAALRDLRNAHAALNAAREELRAVEERRKGWIRAIQPTSGKSSADFEGCVE